ncbi:MAG: uncharacterized protein JWM64_2249 [Frankiales bacterium]|nr:uncharacterized protein [Frankiales bacterium]
MPVRRPLAALLASTALVAAYGVGAVTGPSPASAQEVATTSAGSGVTVAGVGTVNGTPDVLRLALRVVVVRPTADVALRDASTITERVRSALRKQGVTQADLQTTQLSITPSYSGKPAKLVGYQVVQGQGALLRDLGKAGQAITDAVTAGGSTLRFDGVSFLLSDDSPLKVRAREAAFGQAKAKAEQYAKLAGRALGPVEQVQEDVQPYYYGDSSGGAAASAPAAQGVSLDPGTQRVDVRVVVRFALA